VFSEEGVPAELSADGRRVSLNGRAVLGQAEDGAVLLASTADWLDRALHRQETHRALGLELEPAVSLAATAPGIEVGRAIWARQLPLLAELRAARVAGSVALGAVPSLSVHVQVDSAQAAPAAEELLQRLVREGGAGSATQRTGGLRVTRPSGAEVRIEGPWPRERLEDALESVGIWLGRPAIP
jgi:hypothetical protein